MDTVTEVTTLRTELAGLRAEVASLRATVSEIADAADEVKRSEELHRELLRLAAGVDMAGAASVRHLRSV